MSETYIAAELRRLVRARGRGCCEYCGIAEVDHIISEKHGGQTTAENLALACVTCNRAKGSDIATISEDGTLIELFHPRHHTWAEHFVRQGSQIIGRTELGRATAQLLKFNAPERLEERR